MVTGSRVQQCHLEGYDIESSVALRYFIQICSDQNEFEESEQFRQKYRQKIFLSVK